MQILTQSSPGKGVPLSGYPLFLSNDIEETRERVSGVFCPHDLKIAGRNQKLDARMYHASVGPVSFSRLQHGADVSIDPGCLKDFLLVQMPIKGKAEISCGKSHIGSHPKLASVLTPEMPLKMWWSGCCDKIIVRIPREELERQCAQHLGHGLRQPIEFQLGMDVTEKGGNDWLRLVAFLVGELDRNSSMIYNSPLIRAQMVQMLVTTLLFCQPNNYRDTLLRPAPPIAPYYVKRVEEYIAANADQPITIIELSNYAGVSTRALYAGFRNFRNTSPMAHLKEVRLQRAHDDLLNAKQGERVTTIAMRWGFTHLGNFTAAYKRKFGEQPSDTLRR